MQNEQFQLLKLGQYQVLLPEIFDFKQAQHKHNEKRTILMKNLSVSLSFSAYPISKQIDI